MTVLSTTTGLLRVLAVNVNSLCEGLLISNLRSAYVSLYVELTQQTVYDDIQMKLAHTGNDGLACFFVCSDTEGRILLRQLYKSIAHLVLACLGLWLDRDIDNRLRELHGLQDNRMLLITDGIAGGCGLETNSSSNITGIYAV